MAEDNLCSYNTIDNIHMQETYELDSLRKENDRLKMELSKTKDDLMKSKDLVERLQSENMKLLNQNSTQQARLQEIYQSNPMF